MGGIDSASPHPSTELRSICLRFAPTRTRSHPTEMSLESASQINANFIFGMDAHAKMVNLAEAGYKIATAPRRKPERLKLSASTRAAQLWNSSGPFPPRRFPSTRDRRQERLRLFDETKKTDPRILIEGLGLEVAGKRAMRKSPGYPQGASPRIRETEYPNADTWWKVKSRREKQRCSRRNRRFGLTIPIRPRVILTKYPPHNL